MRRLFLTTVILAMGLSACGKDRNSTLSRIRSTGNGPDEFSVVPTKPLETPKEMTTLPPPTPGMSNRADQHPKEEAIYALGGNPAMARSQGIPASDGALVNYAGRKGVTPGIRQVLAQEDQKKRQRYGRRDLFNLSPIDNYTKAYKDEWLNADAESDRLEGYGVHTPTAPPTR